MWFFALIFAVFLKKRFKLSKIISAGGYVIFIGDSQRALVVVNRTFLMTDSGRVTTITNLG
jgi:hypothetical protein